MAAIHLIENGPSSVRKAHGTADEFESGNWKLDIENVERLIGGDLYLHSTQSGPSDFGGVILGYQIIPPGQVDEGRVIFRIKFSPRFRGFTSADGWGGGEKKYRW